MSICSVVVPCIWGLVRGENIYLFCSGPMHMGFS